MDPYKQKLSQMQAYVPFLQKMISKLEKAGDTSKNAQLAKMKSLFSILSDPDKKMRLDTLLQCEDVLHRLHEKIEGQPLYQSSGDKAGEHSGASIKVPDKNRPGPSPRSPSPPAIPSSAVQSGYPNDNSVIHRWNPRPKSTQLNHFMQRSTKDNQYGRLDRQPRFPHKWQSDHNLTRPHFSGSWPSNASMPPHHRHQALTPQAQARPDPWMRRNPALIHPWSAGGGPPRSMDSPEGWLPRDQQQQRYHPASQQLYSPNMQAGYDHPNSFYLNSSSTPHPHGPPATALQPKASCMIKPRLDQTSATSDKIPPDSLSTPMSPSSPPHSPNEIIEPSSRVHEGPKVIPLERMLTDAIITKQKPDTAEVLESPASPTPDAENPCLEQMNFPKPIPTSSGSGQSLVMSASVCNANSSSSNTFPLPQPPAATLHSSATTRPPRRTALLDTPTDWQQPSGSTPNTCPATPSPPTPSQIRPVNLTRPPGSSTTNAYPSNPMIKPPVGTQVMQHQPSNSHFKPLTYGEYRKMKEEAEKKIIPPQLTAGSSVNRRDPRLQPKAEATVTKEDMSPSSAVQSDSLAKKLLPYKIPKKTKVNSEENNDVMNKEEPHPADQYIKNEDLVSTDSEPELQIVEDVKSEEEPHKKGESSKEQMAQPAPSIATSSNTVDKSNEEQLSTGRHLTKEFLASIVSSLAPNEASKVLQRAKMLDDGSTISLKQLKFLLADDSESEEEAEVKEDHPRTVVKGEQKPEADFSSGSTLSSKAKRGRANKPQGATNRQSSATKATRRSSRLKVAQADDYDAAMEEGEASDETKGHECEEDNLKETSFGSTSSASYQHSDLYADDDDKLVIDEEEMVSSDPSADDTREKDGANCSRVEESAPAVRHCADLELSVASAIKEEAEEEPLDNSEVAPVDHHKGTLSLPKSRYSTLKIGLKSDASLPAVRGVRNFCKQKGLQTLQHHVSDGQPQPKKEPKEADVPVFVGTVVVPNDVASPVTRAPIYDPPQRLLSSSKFQGSEAVNSLFNKLNTALDMNDQQSPIHSDTLATASNQLMKELGDALDSVKVVPTQEPQVYVESMGQVVNRLCDMVARTKASNSVFGNDSLNQMQSDATRPCGAGANEESVDRGDDKEVSKLCTSLTTQLSLADRLQEIVESHNRYGDKDSAALAELMRPENLRHLFKCFGKPSCSFSSDDADDFLKHVEQHVADDNGGGVLRCCYCPQVEVSSPQQLLAHVLVKHATHRFQCPHCFVRQSSQVKLLLHQQIAHPDKKMGFIMCRHLPKLQDDSAALDLPPHLVAAAMRCRVPDCEFACENRSSMANHLYQEHDQVVRQFEDFLCLRCPSAFMTPSKMLLHCFMDHFDLNLACTVRRVDTVEADDSESEYWSGSSIDEGYDEDDDGNRNGKLIEDRLGDCIDGLAGHALFKCSFQGCLFSADHEVTFKEHLLICQCSFNAGPSLSCYHCHKPFKHITTLLDHLKIHGPRRYHCSLCTNFKAAVSISVKNHMKSTHKACNTKLMPINAKMGLSDDEHFVMVPKNSIPKGFKSAIAGKLKDTFTPSEINEIPPMSMSRFFLRCANCDFASKVRLNLVKHLRLHLRSERDHDIYFPPLLTPVNQPEIGDGSSFTKMSILIDADCQEEKSRLPMTESELRFMPALVGENERYSCCDADCGYKTIDEVMLAYHIQALHPDMGDTYRCPHCPPDLNVRVPFDDMGFHLRCHGDLLYKCGHCRYYHWQKRTAEKHVADRHPGMKQYVRDVRLEAENWQKSKLSKSAEEPGSDKKKEKKKKASLAYQPFKCGLCEFANEELDEIRRHCAAAHGFNYQFKCSLCPFESDIKTQLHSHFTEAHPHVINTVSMVRIFYVNPSSDLPPLPTGEAGGGSAGGSSGAGANLPLWSRHMTGMKHIRGILFEEDEQEDCVPVAQSSASSDCAQSTSSKSALSVGMKAAKKSSNIQVEDSFSVKCKECGVQKKTIKALKMHIKLLHLRTGKFLCRNCNFSANILNSIQSHYKIRHPEITKLDFEEKCKEGRTFSHDFWKTEWNIPTLAERRVALKLEAEPHSTSTRVATQVSSTGAEKRKRSSSSISKSKRSKKRGTKRKLVDYGNDADSTVKNEEMPSTVMTECSDSLVPTLSVHSAAQQNCPEASRKTPARDLAYHEISPFEKVVTYKCQFCPKRTQYLEHIEKHVKAEHAAKAGQDEISYKVLTRDQVVDLLTLSASSDSPWPEADFACYFCDDMVGSIYQLRDHFLAEHSSNPDDFMVTRMNEAKKLASGYLECQVCGYLSAGFDRSKQRVHFHEEHPLHELVSASKYVCKVKAGTQDSVAKFVASRYSGVQMPCPKELCNFYTTSFVTMTNHLKKHTQTFKCGHCGKTHRNSSEFHQHSAMMHGNKIPDQVKDPEAEAKFEALRGLLEAGLREDSLPDSNAIFNSGGTARKSFAATKSTAGSTETLREGTERLRDAGGDGPEQGMDTSSSVYGQPMPEVDLNNITTQMSIGDTEITLSAAKMHKMMALQPKVLVQDMLRNGPND